jgi:hypothetical protein
VIQPWQGRVLPLYYIRIDLHNVANLTTLCYYLYGRPGEIRTPNLKFRRLAFYPVELRADVGGNG